MSPNQPCSICGNEAAITIPGMTRELCFCKNCILIHPNIPSTVIRELSQNTLEFLLTKIAENDTLSAKLLAQETRIKDIEAASNYNIVESMRSDRDSLVEEVSKLTVLLSKKENEHKKLSSEIESSKELKLDITRILSEFLDTAIERLIATSKRNTAIAQQEQANVTSSMEEILTRIKQLQLEASSPKISEIVPKHKEPRKELSNDNEVTIEELENETS